MNALPNRSIRIAPEHSDVLNSVLALLRAGRADELRDLLADLPRPVGPFRSTEAALDFLVGRMVASCPPQAIWLFGSRARGDNRPDSDFDLLAIFPDDDPADPEQRRRQLAEAVAASGVGVDVMACSAGEFERFRDAPGSLIRTVHQEGREIYVSRAERRKRR